MTPRLDKVVIVEIEGNRFRICFRGIETTEIGKWIGYGVGENERNLKGFAASIY